MSLRVTSGDYRALAEFRYQFRRFLAASEEAARSVGLEPEQYQLLLEVEGRPVGAESTIRALAQRLYVHHNTVVERLDRLARLRLLRRHRSHKDGREVLVELTARGKGILAKLAGKRMTELNLSGSELIAALAKVISATRRMHKKSASRRGVKSGNRKRRD